MCKRWIIEPAPIPSDIIWEKFNQKKPHHYFYDIILNFLLLVLTIFVSTPIRQADFLVRYLNFLLPGKQKDLMTTAMCVEVLSITFTNSFLIPQLVYNVAEFLFYETRTQKDISKMFKYFFYIFINAIILPLAQFTQIIDIVKFIYRPQESFDVFQEQFGANLIDKSQLFMKYLLTCSLVSQAVALLDLPHYFYVFRTSRS